MMNGSSTSQREASPSNARLSGRWRWSRRVGIAAIFLVVAVEPALAQSIGEEFCSTDMATTIRNIFTVIQFGGPLIGGTLAVGAAVLTPTVRRSDIKKELKEVRNQGIIWGVIMAPLATAIIQFILNAVVAGGSSCTF